MHFHGKVMTFTVWLLIDCAENVVRDAYNSHATTQFNTSFIRKLCECTQLAKTVLQNSKSKIDFFFWKTIPIKSHRFWYSIERNCSFLLIHGYFENEIRIRFCSYSDSRSMDFIAPLECCVMLCYVNDFCYHVQIELFFYTFNK